MIGFECTVGVEDTVPIRDAVIANGVWRGICCCVHIFVTSAHKPQSQASAPNRRPPLSESEEGNGTERALKLMEELSIKASFIFVINDDIHAACAERWMFEMRPDIGAIVPTAVAFWVRTRFNINLESKLIF